LVSLGHVSFLVFFPAFFRSDWKRGILMILCSLVTFGFSWLIFVFIYNKLFIKELVNNGYKVKSIQTGTKEQLEHVLGFSLATI